MLIFWIIHFSVCFNELSLTNCTFWLAEMHVVNENHYTLTIALLVMSPSLSQSRKKIRKTGFHCPSLSACGFKALCSFFFFCYHRNKLNQCFSKSVSTNGRKSNRGMALCLVLSFSGGVSRYSVCRELEQAHRTRVRGDR